MKVIVTLVALLTLFAGCDMFSEPENAKLSGGGSGFSLVKVTIGGNARTLLPNAYFSKYALSAASADSGYTGAVPSPVEIDGDWGSIGVPYGNWIITATAYVNAGGVDYPAAKGSAPISVYEDSQWVEITINAPESGGTGTFTYKVTYPAGGSASVELRPIGGGALVVNAAAVANGSAVNANNIASGIYFLTVKATNGRTVTRNEVVHIYNRATTEADYIFTKLDFGTGSLRIEGTINLLINGTQQANMAGLVVHYADGGSYIPLNFTGTDGSATWECDIDNLHGAKALNFRIDFIDEIDLLTIPVPLNDITGIDLGTVNIEFEIIPLVANTWANGYISGNPNYAFYAMNVTEGQTYYLWWNDSDQGDGTKSLDIMVRALYDDLTFIGFVDGNGDSAWDFPASFTAEKTGTVYVVVSPYWGRNTGTYAIAYSTD
jgi:hypothetical protein